MKEVIVGIVVAIVMALLFFNLAYMISNNINKRDDAAFDVIRVPIDTFKNGVTKFHNIYVIGDHSYEVDVVDLGKVQVIDGFNK